MRKLLTLVAASVAISAVAGAQDTRPDDIACQDSAASAGLYRRCALTMLDNGTRVVRGAGGVVVANRGLFSRVHLQRIVAGDSAKFYATRFEKNNRAAGLFKALGVGLMTVSIFKADCSSRNNGCAYDWSMNSPGLKLLVGGAGLAIVGRVIEISAARQGAMAVWWNNERFSR
jgi:hypothetical protein